MIDTFMHKCVITVVICNVMKRLEIPSFEVLTSINDARHVIARVQ
jgi:hypothetical protein